MRRFGIVLILAGTAASLGGCRADRASQQASAIDSRINDLPKRESPDTATLPAPATEPDDNLHDQRPRIVCFGDSLTAGYGTEAGQTYPDYLQADLDALGYKYRVLNAGVSGNTTKDGLERVERVVAMRPSVVVLEFGGNDGLRGFRLEDSRANLARIIETLQASGAKVVLAGITLPPDYGPDYVNKFNDMYKVLAKEYQVPMLPFLLKDVFGVEGMMQRDRIHATARGNKVVADNVLPLVLPLLKK